MTPSTLTPHLGDSDIQRLGMPIDASASIGQLGLEAGAYLTGMRHRFSTGASELLSQKVNPMKIAEDVGVEYRRLFDVANLGNSAIATGLFIEGHKISGGNFLERTGEVMFMGDTAPYHMSPRKEFLEVMYVEKLLHRGNKYRPIKLNEERKGFPSFGAGNIYGKKDSIFIRKEYLGSIHIALLQSRGIQMEMFMDEHGVECVRFSLA